MPFTARGVAQDGSGGDAPSAGAQELTPTAGLASQQTVDRSDAIPIGPWTGLGGAVAYAFASLVVTLWLVRRRDA